MGSVQRATFSLTPASIALLREVAELNERSMSAQVRQLVRDEAEEIILGDAAINPTRAARLRTLMENMNREIDAG